MRVLFTEIGVHEAAIPDERPLALQATPRTPWGGAQIRSLRAHGGTIPAVAARTVSETQAASVRAEGTFGSRIGGAGP